MSIHHLIKPKSIAVVGATDKPGSFGNFTAVNACQNADNVNVYLINHKSDTVLGRKAYKSLKDLPEVPDCIMICTPQATVIPLMTEAGEMGVKAAILVASGYSEEGTEAGRKATEELREVIDRYGMKVMGPNCTGFINNVDKVKLWGMGGTDFDMKTRKTGVATFANSGTMAIHTVSCPYLDISYAFSMGNCDFLSIEEVLDVVLEDPEVKVIGMYLEGARNPGKLLECFRKANELGKPVIIHAAGMSQKGAASAASHTGNMASSRRTYDAIFKKYGVIMVENTDEYLAMMNIMSLWHGNMPKRARFASMNSSGGENTVCADMAEKWGVPMHDFTPETIAKLKSKLPGYASPKNPLDMTAIPSAGMEFFVDLYETIADDPNVDALFDTAGFAAPNDKDREMGKVFGWMPNDRQGNPMVAFRSGEKALPMAVVPSTEGTRDMDWRIKLAEHGVPILPSSNTGYNVLGKVCKYIETDRSIRTLEHAVPEKAHGKDTVALTEFDSKKELAEIGLPMPKQAIVKSKEELAKVVAGFNYPLVLKISSPDIMHKTEAGGVKVGVPSLTEALGAYSDILASCRAYKPDAKIDGILVQEMAAPGTEMIIGVTSDAKFGPMLMVGMGGVFVEVFQDVAMYPCPLGKEEALEMIKSLKSYKLLAGYRGSKPCDIDALAELMVKISRYAQEHKDEVKELDLNPVFVYPEGNGVSVVDALLVKYAD